MNTSRIYAFVLNPWVVIISLGAGVAFGMLAPLLATPLAFVGDIYVDLLKMITLPFMVSAVIFSLQRLFRDGGTASLLGRVALVFLGFSAFVAIAGAVTLLILRPGENLPASTMQTFGQIVGGDLSASDTAMNLRGVDEVKKTASFADMLVSLVPANIFSALANGDTLKTLVFALLFGLAVGHVPTRISDGLTQALETVYHACQTLMRWLSFPLPVVLFCMSAAQLGKTGIEPLKAMGAFVVAFLIVSALLLAVAAIIIWKRSNGTLGQTLNALRGPFALALATRSSATCMPIMIESLVTRLGFARSRVELLVPLTVSLLRIGPVVYYVCATLFIAQIYGRSLTPVEIGIVLTSSVLAGFASAGMTGLVTVSLIGMTCTYLGLPFEAAFILFLAVDPVCDMLRTLVLVIGNTAAVAVVCPRPLKI
ncbi:cation:dicarboxylase symporter family transporter [Variovorax sp. NFACC27]|uniref:Cation:dicarboxylase symporter family transporter n=1 Tax=Variovorax gossypii TaxID=1679495 RepID=A0A431TFI7_9BURK|nr:MULTISPECIES: cation:dicarboxylase symporter family transporter [Variovorax]MDP9606685.1 Na+/H+-dicarboxylate symporter [Variovorax paradoxus]SEF25099.1 Na+/H+-dicarboxylate symporter [Variovorax sp. NFACC28]SEG33664.1 Na+/H+-dicarboxylate symporter [Variovorax sp. NFACC29]SFC37911.1 Na+/H+-dicarboxylate symporter [Variovorax sp. NFACC26]SFF89099.1 Na+/H+-dicarboxylate symporter [Variovorax sp. NFACC27]